MDKVTQLLSKPYVSDLSKPANHSAQVRELLDIWLDDYESKTPEHKIVEVETDNFSYLFDILNERLIAAWGISSGKQHNVRDKARMAKHPLGVPNYHRGHVIPHQLGGGLDINLVTQRGSLNVGPFRALERKAVATPGALYFTYWTYGPNLRNGRADQRPSHVYQGVLEPGQHALVSKFTN